MKIVEIEHFRKAKELSFIFPPEDKRRILLQEEIDQILLEIKKLKDE